MMQFSYGEPPTCRSGWRRTAAWTALLLAGLLLGTASGCAALTNPVADAFPARRLPPELLAPAREEEQTIPLACLGQQPPMNYQLAAGDVLGVYIEGVLGERTQPLPLQVAPLVQVRDQRRLPPAAGYPITVREDGTIALPMIDPISVVGLTLPEVEQVVRKVYIEKQIIKAGAERILVTLLHPRTCQVVVFRQESANISIGIAGELGGGKRGTGHVVDLPAYENDVLHALAETGGLPGLDAFNEVRIQRNCFRDESGRAAVLRDLVKLSPGACLLGGGTTTTIRIPLRLPPGQPLPIHPEDVILHTGDVVFLEARDNDLFYTAGLLPAGEHVLPRDHDLDVLEAVAQVRGSMLNGAFATNSLSGNLIAPGIGEPSPSLVVVLRRTPGGGQAPIRVDLNRALTDPRERLIVQPGDVVLLQEKPSEALARYFTQTFFNFDLAWEAFHSRYVSGIVDVAAPDRLPGRVSITNFTAH